MAADLCDDILVEVFSYLDLRDLSRCQKVCRKWRRFLTCSDGAFWRTRFEETSREQFRSSPLLSSLPSFRAKVEAFACAWNPKDSSPNIYIKEDALTLHRNPVAQSTDAIRGKVGFTAGVHYWVVIFRGPSFGSTAVVGVSTKQASLHCNQYSVLLGSDKYGWGWDLPKQMLWHGGDKRRSYPAEDRVGIKVRKLLHLLSQIETFFFLPSRR